MPDVVIIGAGISGIDLAVRLQQWTDKTFTILEAKDTLGGTWELFKYPGVRSDSDLHTFGFAFKPWNQRNSIAEGPAILRYLQDTVKEYHLDDKIQYNHKVESAAWNDGWTLKVDSPQGHKTIDCRFVLFCTGYFDHDEALKATIPGLDTFKGQIVHPQFWPTDLDYYGKDVVIIGSGATTITLLPSLAKSAKHVTQLQRSPSYVVSQTQEDPIDRVIRLLPWVWAAKLLRVKFFLLPWVAYILMTTFPKRARNFLKSKAAKLLPPGYPMDPNFDPRYNPWEQRLCVSPEGEYFKALSTNAEVLTSHIKTVTSDSIVLENQTLKPDIIITATGLKLLVAGGIKITVHGKPYDPATNFMYRGCMLQDLPNAALSLGYISASWTLGADVTAHFVTRLLNEMDRTAIKTAIPRPGVMGEAPAMNLSSTYIKVGKALPKAGDRWPWKARNMYLRDLWDAKMYGFDGLEMTG